MTIPKIVQVAGSRNSEYVILMCTGCNEYYSYSVRQYKGDFGCNITEFEHFLMWARCEAAKHECFLSGRVGYIDDPLTYHVDFPQEDLEKLAADGGEVAERHEDPWGGVGYIVEPEDKDDLDAWMDEELDLPPLPFACGIGDIVDTELLDAAKVLAFRRLYEMGPSKEEPFGDNYDWEENRFDFLLDVHEVYETVTGRIVRHPTIREIPRVRSFDIEIDYAGMEQRFVDAYMLAAGVYSLDNLGCLRDEKGRCLACLRPGPHLPFYWGQE